MPDEIVFPFWKKYIESDMLDREKMLDIISKNIIESSSFPDEKIREHSIKLQLMSYFDDLIDTIWEMNNLKKEAGHENGERTENN